MPSATVSGGIQRLAWFAALWAASVTALGVVAYLLRWMLHP